jgi:hypothetical protein
VKPWTRLAFGITSASDVPPAWDDGGNGRETDARKLSFDNRSPDFPHFFADEDEGDVTFGR